MEGVLFYPILTLTIAKSLVIDLFFSLPKKDPHVQFHIKFFSWTPPPLGSTKLNSDGSARGNPGQASAGGLIRDSSGTGSMGTLETLDSQPLSLRKSRDSVMASIWDIVFLQSGLEKSSSNPLRGKQIDHSHVYFKNSHNLLKMS